MDQTLKFIYKTLYFVGFDQFYSKPSEKIYLYLKRVLFLPVDILFQFTCFWCICDKNVDFSERIFIFLIVIGKTSVDWQYWTIWSQAAAFMKLFNWVSGLHKTQEDEITERMSRTGYVNLSDVLRKLIRFEMKFNILSYTLNASLTFRILVVIYSIVFLTADIMPLFLPSIDFMLPMKIPFSNINTTFGYYSNFFLQDFITTSYGVFYGTFNIIFITFSAHLLQELKFIANLCKNVGKFERNVIVQETLSYLNTGIGESERKKVQHIGTSISTSHLTRQDDKNYAHAYKEFHFLSCIEEEDPTQSRVILKIIWEHHNEALR